MNKFDLLYVGELPPPYGGVAVKNKLVYDEIFKGDKTKFVDLVECRRKKWKIPLIGLQLVLAMKSSKTIVYGMGTYQRLKFLIILQRLLLGKSGLQRAILLIMGGQFHNTVAKDLNMIRMLKSVRSIWVESAKMAEELKTLGLYNSFLFPNCRTNRNAKAPVDCRNSATIKLVFFSRICEEKGVRNIIEAVKQLKNLHIDFQLFFYGELDSRIEIEFLKFIDEHNNVHYCGVFDSTNDDVYAELNKYDIMLFPSFWNGEGVPGTLVEAKMAGITAVVSDWKYNSEIVTDGIEGIVLHDPITQSLVNCIVELASNKEKLYSLKQKAFESSERYSIEKYKTILRNEAGI